MNFSRVRMRNVRFSILLAALIQSLFASSAGHAEIPHWTIRSGDSSVVLHWNASSERGYYLYRGLSENGPYLRLHQSPINRPCYADFAVTNGTCYWYRVKAIDNQKQEGPLSSAASAIPHPFVSDDAFLDYVQQTAFDYFWLEANPANGLIRDRTQPDSFCSIAAVGFGLTAIGIGIDRGWITRSEGLNRALITLQTFCQGRQGDDRSGIIGHRGWFYHFLDMNTGGRFRNVELSSIDTALLLAGVLSAKQYFDGTHADEQKVRDLAAQLFGRVDWQWMAQNSDVFSMGWHPETGFIPSKWIGYNEAMILYLMAMGAEKNRLPSSAWKQWTSGYRWEKYYGQSYVPFPPLFGHQYSHCWVDFRGQADAYMRAKQSTYFENSRRATLAQRAYCIDNPLRHAGYGATVWGLTASDGPRGYSARGAPPAENDDGTLSPTAIGGSMPFAPEFCLPALRHLYSSYREELWTPYGFRDAFNLRVNWWGPDVLGIDQGPILIMIENYRTGSVWQRFMRNPEIQRGLKTAGFEKNAN